jgi:hypothetical protein
MITFVILAVLSFWIYRARARRRAARRILQRKQAKKLCWKVMNRLMAETPAVHACSGIPTPDLDAAFEVMARAGQLMKSEAI